MGGTVDRLDFAEAVAESILATPSATPMISDRARAGLALVAVLRGDIAAAEAQYTALSPTQGIVLTSGDCSG
ncbi:MAG: hypothetical protein ACE5Q6_14140 [Dehalococcoidia bacterium]